jgi:uncharacterized protein YndB with AHSA1/START domain
MNASYAKLVAADTVRFERILPGPIERVWAFLTESGKRARWLAAGAMELHVGGRVELVFRNSDLTENDDPPPEKYAGYGAESRMDGRITACEPPRLLAYTWGGESGSGASEVRFELGAQGDEVRLLLTHTRLPNREQMLSVAGGWHAHLALLSDHLADRNPDGFWRTHTRLESEYERLIPPA